MARIRYLLSFLLIVGLASLLAGCSSSKSLQGKITYGGQPLPVGTITFDPDRSKGNDGARRSGNIKDGVYHTSPVDGPPLQGPVIVKIFGYDGKPLPGKEGQLSPNGTPLCFPHEERIELTPGQSTYDFNIPETNQ
jgi:hypothetical protein